MLDIVVDRESLMVVVLMMMVSGERCRRQLWQAVDHAGRVFRGRQVGGVVA